MSESLQDIVVIGGGLMGSSAAWQLSKSGADVLLIEQQDANYTFGSSYGKTRISRSLGPKKDVFSYLQQTSVRETQSLISYLNEAKPEENHSMEDIYVTSPVTYIYYQTDLEEVQGLLDGQLDVHEYAANPIKAQELFGMTIPETAMVIREYKEYSGTVNPKELISKLHQGIKTTGSEINFGESIVSLTKMETYYELLLRNVKSGENRTIHAKKIVCAAGAYTGEILQTCAPYFSQLITPKHVFLAFLKIDKLAYEKLSSEEKKRLKDFYPVANINDEFFYSMFDELDSDGIPVLKVGGHLIRKNFDSLKTVWQLELSQAEIDWSLKNTADYLKCLNLPIGLSDLQFLKGNSCVYSMTASEVPYVTHLLGENSEPDPNFVVLGGMSGIGAKGSLAYGLIAANLLLGKDDSSEQYQITKNSMGFDRLLNDLK